MNERYRKRKIEDGEKQERKKGREKDRNKERKRDVVELYEKSCVIRCFFVMLYLCIK